MKFKKLILLSSVLFIFCSAIYGQNVATENVPLVERTPDNLFQLNFDNKISLIEFQREVFFWNNGPAGIVYARNENLYDEENTFQPQSLMLKDILNSFVKTKTDYSWNETNGVINLFPKNGYTILDERIAEFKAEKVFPSELREKLLQTIEFQNYLKTNGLIDKVPDAENKYGLIISGFRGKPNERNRISIDLKNATVREILNEIVRQKNRTWVYYEYDLISDGENYRIFRLEL